MTATYQITRDEVLKAAWQTCQVLGEGEALSSTQITDSLPFLQSLLKMWNMEGYNAWLYATINWPSQAAKASYTIGTAGSPDINQDRPVRMPSAWTQDASGNKTPLNPFTQQEFSLLTPPTAPGPPNSYLYDRQLSLGVFKPWPVPSDTSLTFYALVQRPISDLAASGSATFDIEQEWFIPLIWCLAEQLMGIAGTEEQQCRRIEKNAEKFLEKATNFTQEDGSVYFQPNPQGGMSGRG